MGVIHTFRMGGGPGLASASRCIAGYRATSGPPGTSTSRRRPTRRTSHDAAAVRDGRVPDDRRRGERPCLERSPVDADAAVAGLDRDVRSIVATHDGSVVKARGEGDSHFAVFSEASAAIAAAAALQRRPDTRLAARAAVLIGEAEPRDGDYLGPVVNHGARIRSVAHGGQTVTTRSVVDVASSRLPDDLTFRTLGIHRVRDIADPIELFQLFGPGLRAPFRRRTPSPSRPPWSWPSLRWMRSDLPDASNTQTMSCTLGSEH